MKEESLDIDKYNLESPKDIVSASGSAALKSNLSFSENESNTVTNILERDIDLFFETHSTSHHTFDISRPIKPNERDFGFFDSSLPEGVHIKGWKLVESFSSRVIELYESSVILECLIDREHKEYEEKEFKKSIFDEIDLVEGKLLKLCFYERTNQIMMEVIDNPKLVLDSDFPTIDFSEQFKNLTLKKRV